MQHSVIFDLAREENLTLVLVQVTRLVVMQVRKVDVDLKTNANTHKCQAPISGTNVTARHD